MVAQFEPRTFPDFVQRMAARIVARTDLTDLEDGGVLLTIIGALARELDDISYQMVRLQDIFDIDTATGGDLDARAKDYNPDALTRLGAVRATGKVRFYRLGNAGNVVIPSGVSVEVDGGESYTTADEGVIADGETKSEEILTVATIPGSASNIVGFGYLDPVMLAGSPDLTPDDIANGPTGISKIVGTIAGVESVRNTSGLTGGSDAETDTQFRTRIKTYLRSLSRATPYSLESAVLGVTLPDYGRIQVAKVVELQEPNLGKVLLYVDDGTGSSATIQIHNYETDPITGNPTGFIAERVVESAAGGEIRLYLKHFPLVSATEVIVVWTSQSVLAGGPDVDTPTTLVRGFADSADGTYDYRLNAGSGKLTLYAGGPTGIATEAVSPVGVEGLQALDSLTVRYTYFGGLIEEAQRIIDGDTTNRLEYPGIRAAGVDVRCLAPQILNQTIEATINVDPGFNHALVLKECKGAIMTYINSLDINGDIIITELVHVLQSVSGVRDIIWTSGGDPFIPANIMVGEGELARVALADILLTGT